MAKQSHKKQLYSNANPPQTVIKKKPENDELWKNSFSCEKPSLQAKNSPYDWSFFEKQLISPDLEFQIRFE